MKIYKYPLPVDDMVKIPMPKGARILSIQTQNGTPEIWALVDESAASVRRGFAVRGTGHSANGLSADRYIATFQMHGGSLVFHVFDLGEELG